MSNNQSNDQLLGEVACSIAATLDVIGDRWTLLILRDIFRGYWKFGELLDEGQMARNLLSNRLNALIAHGVLEKIPYQDRPVRYEYRLTKKGTDLSSALVALMAWGDRWYAEHGPPTLLVHTKCDTPLHEVVRCSTCNETVGPGGIRSRPGPGRKPA